MKKVTIALIAATALLLAISLPGYAAGAGASLGAHVRAGQAAWGGHPPSGGGPASAWSGHSNWGGHSHSQFFFSGSIALGPWWPWYPWYPSSYYPAPQVVVQQQAQVYAEPAPSQTDYWYYCQNSQGYYPYVKSCPGGWMKVVPETTPPQYRY